MTQTSHRIGATTHGRATHLSRCAGQPRRTTSPSSGPRSRPVIPIRRSETPRRSRPHAAIGITRRSEQSRLCRGRHNLDLLFYHLKLRCYIVIELKTGAFKPEYAGQISFYLSAVDALMKTEADHPTIGLLLCQEHKRLVVEYALRGMGNPIGVAQYQFVAELPVELQDSLPSVETLTQEFGMDVRLGEGDSE